VDASRRADLVRVRASVRERARLLEQRLDARAARSRLLGEVDSAAEHLRETQRAYDRLTRGMRGWLRQRLGRVAGVTEAATALEAARTEHDGLMAELRVFDTRITTLDATLEPMGDVEARYAELLAELELAAVASNSPHAQALVAFAASAGRLAAARGALVAAMATGYAAKRLVETVSTRLEKRTAGAEYSAGALLSWAAMALWSDLELVSDALSEVRRAALGAAAIIPGIAVERVRGLELALKRTPASRADLALATSELRRLKADLATLMSDLRGHERAMRDAEASLTTERERVVDLERERL